MFTVNISDGKSRESALYLLEFYDITFQIQRMDDKLRYLVFDAGPINNARYRECEAAFQWQWHQAGGCICEYCRRHETQMACSIHETQSDTRDGLTFTYPIE
jgi:hypothetical protein